MKKALYFQIKNETAILKNLKLEGRTDATALITIAKVEKRIKTLEEIYESKKEASRRKEVTKHRPAGRLVQYVLQIVHRQKHYKDIWHHAILKVFANAELQNAEVTK